jgi:hypothetical protein
MSGSGRVSRIPFEYNGAQLHERGRKALRGRNQVLTSSYRKADAAIIFMEKAVRDLRRTAFYGFPEKKVGGPGTKPQARLF